MIRLLFAAILTLCFACGADFRFQYNAAAPINQGPCKHMRVYVDTQFGEADKISIDNAVNAWNYVLNGYIKLEVASYKFDMDPNEIKAIVNEHGIMILKINSSSSFIPPPKVMEGSIAGITTTLGGDTVYLIRDRISDMVEPILLHELGHVLGAPDMEGQTLMSWLFSPKYSRCIDKRSMEAVAAYQHLDPSKLNYCVYYGD